MVEISFRINRFEKSKSQRGSTFIRLHKSRLKSLTLFAEMEENKGGIFSLTDGRFSNFEKEHVTFLESDADFSRREPQDNGKGKNNAGVSKSCGFEMDFRHFSIRIIRIKSGRDSYKVILSEKSSPPSLRYGRKY